MRFTKISIYRFVFILFFSQLMVSCSDRNSSDDNTELSQIASDPTNVCTVSPDNHSSALCYRIGDNSDQQLNASAYSGKVSGHVDSTGLTKINLELDGNAKISLQSMANGTGTVKTHHVGMSSSTYQTNGGEYYTPRPLIKTIVRAFYTLDQVLTKVDEQSIRMATTLRKYVASQFKPSIAKAFYDYYASESVLDFSAGWGDRLAGFYCGTTTKHYVGIDPNTNNHPGYKKQVEFYKKHQTWFEEPKKVDLICSPAEDVDYSKYHDHFDMVFTSPPYFDVERYSDADTQSWVRYKNIDSWNKNFLHKTLGKIIPAIRTGGRLAINIADVYDAKSKDYFDICNPMNEFIESQGMKYDTCMGMQMTKRFNSGGAGNAKSEYFEEHLREKTKDTKDVAFGEPIWIWEKK